MGIRIFDAESEYDDDLTTDFTNDTDSTHSCQAQPVPKALSEISEISVCEKKSVRSVRWVVLNDDAVLPF